LLDFLFQFASIDLFHGDSITHYAVIFKYLVAEVIIKQTPKTKTRNNTFSKPYLLIIFPPF